LTGKNSVLINQELDRISNGIKEWFDYNPVHVYSQGQVRSKLDSIISNTRQIQKRKSIQDYFEEFLLEKGAEVNANTRQLVTAQTIQTYRNAFSVFAPFAWELEEITKKNYQVFLSHLLKSYKPNTVGKTIRRLKTFFIWCDLQALPISNEFKFWKTLNETTKEETRALNSEQINQIYNLEIDPVEVFAIAKSLHGKTLDSGQVQKLVKSIDDSRKQALAIASIAPHIKDFWKLDLSNVHGDLIKYNRGKNGQACIAPFIDNHIWHAREFANMEGGKLFRTIHHINHYLTYVRDMCNIPFPITVSNFRKTFGSIIYFESDHPNKLGVIMKAYGHKKESTTRIYLGIQEDDLIKDHSEIF
jgi:site-specific recombinase XerD